MSYRAAQLHDRRHVSGHHEVVVGRIERVIPQSVERRLDERRVPERRSLLARSEQIHDLAERVGGADVDLSVRHQHEHSRFHLSLSFPSR